MTVAPMEDPEELMPRSLSITGIPEFHGSQTSLRRRKCSFNEPIRNPAMMGIPGTDLLLDPITLTQVVNIGNHADCPIENVRRLVQIHPEEPPPLFTELMKYENEEEWRQVSRWVRYEQIVEGEFTRFSKPHITLVQIQSLLQVKNCLKKGLVLLDLEADGFENITKCLIDGWVERGSFRESMAESVRSVLLAKKQHLGSIPGYNHFQKVHSKFGGAPKSVENGLKEMKQSKENQDVIKNNIRLFEKLSNHTEGAAIMVGKLKSLEKPISAFVRLREPQVLYPCMPDVPVPVRFIFIVLSPVENYENELNSIGRTMGALLSDEIFCKVAVHCSEPTTLKDSVEEFFSQIVAVPPGKCSANTRWEPREADSKETRHVGMLYATYNDVLDSEEIESEHGNSIVRTGKLFGGLVQDISTKSSTFCSDFFDYFGGRMSQSLAATIFLFFANITSIITFGAVMERTLHHQMAAMEAILCGGLCGIIFGLFSGQPLNILSATGPTLVFEKILFDFCIGNGWEFLPFRCCVGVWIAVYLLILIATDMSSLVGLITRFTEEAFATLISVVFIIQAFQKLLEISHDAPIVADPREVYHSPCFCHLDQFDATLNTTVKLKIKDVTAEDCEHRGGESHGLQCHFKPDVYMLSVLLTFGTFALAYGLNKFRYSKFFGSKLRNALSDFGVVIAIVWMTIVSHWIGLDVPSLNVPTEFKPTLDRSWLIDITSIPNIYVALIAALPAAFYTILIVMDQQITAVIINRKDNLLRKGHGYHLDLLVIAILIVICSFLGLPFFVAATVLSVMHVDALRLQSESSAPGELPQFLGVKEQRLTAILAHLLIGLSVFLTGIIKLVPLPVLIGIFLYMGVVSLLGQQFVQRIALLFMSIKHQPDYSWLRNVRMKRVHLFTIIQILSIIALFLVKYTKVISMMFPLMLVFMVLIRMFVLGKIFSKEELCSLDDIPPTFSEVMKPRKDKLEKVPIAEQLTLLENGKDKIIEEESS